MLIKVLIETSQKRNVSASWLVGILFYYKLRADPRDTRIMHIAYKYSPSPCTACIRPPLQPCSHQANPRSFIRHSFSQIHSPFRFLPMLGPKKKKKESFTHAMKPFESSEMDEAWPVARSLSIAVFVCALVAAVVRPWLAHARAA